LVNSGLPCRWKSANGSKALPCHCNFQGSETDELGANASVRVVLRVGIRSVTTVVNEILQP
jgi:hypothetical protein